MRLDKQHLADALKKCEAEPIHQIGQIQPHGALLVFSQDTPHLILQASENLCVFLGHTEEIPYGKPLATLFDETSYQYIAQLNQEARSHSTVTGKLRIRQNQAAVDAQLRLFTSANLSILELMPDTASNEDDRLPELLLLLQQVLSNTENNHDIGYYFTEIAQLVQTLTGFDRVMVYRFGANWDGEVIAESRVEQADSYLGLQFPASDIPAQARRLYSKNLVRHISDINARPLAIHPTINPLTQLPLDMTHSSLRSLSPIHVEYLRNMGVQASMSISLLQNGRLWGLIACHHLTAKSISNPLQEAAAFISRMVSIKLSSIEAIEQRNLVNQAIHIVGELLKYISTDTEEAILLRLLPDLIKLAHADGVLMMVEGKRYLHGDLPSPEAITQLLAWLGTQEKTEILSDDQLGLRFPPATEYADIASGILATPLSSDMRNCIIWLRKEKLRTVHWAGKTDKTLNQDQHGKLYLSPRQSFEAWTESWRGRSEPWTHVEQGITAMLAVVVTEGLSKKSQLAQALESHKQVEAELRIAATAFESQEGIILTDATGTILRVNHAFTQITGYSAEDAVGKKPNMLRAEHYDAPFYESLWHTLKTKGVWEGEIWNKRKNGETYPEHITITAVKDSKGTVKNYVGTLIDITTSKAAADEIERLAYYDPLTGLPNRRLLIDRLKQALTTSGHSNRQGALLFIDLDNFKTLNDTLGHDKGDLLLQKVSKRLKNCVREGDTVSRLGGDEFVIMLENLSAHAQEAMSQTQNVADKILTSLTQPYQLAEHVYRNSPSIGAVLFKGHTLDTEDLLKQADIAMYQAKKAGRNTFCFFDPQMQTNITLRAELETDLRQALLNNQFKLYYQIQSTHSSQDVGAEVLLRWQHPTRGLVSPAHFIPLAEETGLILSIGQWVLETACAQLKSWQQNTATKDLVLSVNVSAKQLYLANFVSQVQSIVKHHGINPLNLKLELTESILLGDIEATIATMKALREIGIRFSLDDFGTGYSSLQYLKRLPLDQLKIDQSFVRDLPNDSSDQAIVRTIIAMAKALDLNVIAEGVETEAQREFLERHGCSIYQGYLFGKPVPLEDFENLLLKSHLKL